MIKLKLLLAFVLLTGLYTYGQSTITLKAFKQAVMPGTVPVVISENAPSDARAKQKPAARYFLYLIYPQGETVQPLQVWIQKKAYKVTVEPVASTPVEHINRNIPARPVTTVLVAKTKNKVVRLLPATPADSATPPASLRKLVNANELVVTYKRKGKTCQKAIQQITELEPEMAE